MEKIALLNYIHKSLTETKIFEEQCRSYFRILALGLVIIP